MKTEIVRIKCSVCPLVYTFTKEEAKEIKKVTCKTCKEK